MEKAVNFHDKEHEKVWLIKVATNHCRDMHRQGIRHPSTNIEEVTAYCEIPEQSEVLEALVRLPDRELTEEEAEEIWRKYEEKSSCC